MWLRTLDVRIASVDTSAGASTTSTSSGRRGKLVSAGGVQCSGLVVVRVKSSEVCLVSEHFIDKDNFLSKFQSHTFKQTINMGKLPKMKKRGLHSPLSNVKHNLTSHRRLSPLKSRKTGSITHPSTRQNTHHLSRIETAQTIYPRRSERGNIQEATAETALARTEATSAKRRRACRRHHRHTRQEVREEHRQAQDRQSKTGRVGRS